MKKIYYLWLRQIKKYWRSKPRLIGTLFQPVVFLIYSPWPAAHLWCRAKGHNLNFPNFKARKHLIYIPLLFIPISRSMSLGANY